MKVSPRCSLASRHSVRTWRGSRWWRAPLPRRSGLDFLRLFPSGSIRRIQFHLLVEFRQGSRQVAL